jgi:hypothetical protein
MICAGTAWVVTRYPDGTEVHAHPGHGLEDVARAAALGYGDVDAMTFDHDPLHTHLCWALGVGPSPTLRGVATGVGPEVGIAAAEEAMVLAAQRFLCLVRAAAGG